ncbi:peptidase associated/transthyretin-like domain-containing protein [[Clostridium] fimetarium]|uniref:Carboxypeptidase regulatory-like domain-containing protein n=1 Tax=[Clostridium] fimetarium TaxID=99656 RepID=A0A1I0Q886_9FIRM|nr:carboxypeptidase regulatory-like domain-containing protein [[Clostridium] fimetarium]SEW23223.1 hypothetical protein SAMN05421659_10785 [[Clostridium] fimetarium]
MLPRIILTGCQIICSGIVTLDVTLSVNAFIFIAGIVYDPSEHPLPDAAVVVYIIDNTTTPPTEKRLGVTFTVADGSYGISLPRVKYKEYKLVAYSPG